MTFITITVIDECVQCAVIKRSPNCYRPPSVGGSVTQATNQLGKRQMEDSIMSEILHAKLQLALTNVVHGLN